MTARPWTDTEIDIEDFRNYIIIYYFAEKTIIQRFLYARAYILFNQNY